MDGITEALGITAVGGMSQQDIEILIDQGNPTWPSQLVTSFDVGRQASNPSKGAWLSITLDSTALMSVIAGQTHSAAIALGITKAEAEAGIAYPMADYKNSFTDGIALILGIRTALTMTFSIYVPPGGWFCVRKTSGNPILVRVQEQLIGF